MLYAIQFVLVDLARLAEGEQRRGSARAGNRRKERQTLKPQTAQTR